MPDGSRDQGPKPAQLIAGLAQDYEAHLLQQHRGILLVALPLRLSDGRIVNYVLSIDGRSPSVVVHEQSPTRLPAFCPDRHINRGGVFCMNWQAADPLFVTDRESAIRWWSTLLEYLRLQERARQRKQWPGRVEWAHGDAAVYQRIAETCALALGPTISTALTARRLKVVRPKGQSSFLRLEDAGARLYSVWREARRVVTLRQACFCGSGRPLTGCSDHAEKAVQLVFALKFWESTEREFWESAGNTPCCQTLTVCPLRRAVAGTLPVVEQQARRAIARKTQAPPRRSANPAPAKFARPGAPGAQSNA